MSAAKRFVVSTAALGLGAGFLFTVAFLWDSHFAAASNDPLTIAIKANTAYVGLFTALAAGYLTASIARRKPIWHATGLSLIVVATCLVQSANIWNEPWWGIIFGDLVPVVACALAIGVGGLLQRRVSPLVTA